MIRLASLFDGIGGFPLAAERHGITPVWASEIEDFPMAVTKMRFPDMQHLGNICELDGAKLPPVEIVAGGSPCQDISVANGARKGLAGARSGLFFEQIRVIREMREEDIRRGRTAQFIRPRFAIFENVAGLYSSGDPPGEDLRVVLEEFARIVDRTVVVPRPPSGRWEPAGCIMGTGFSIAFRLFDARYWTVPQRRRRIFALIDFGGHTAPQILFDPDRVPWDSAPGGAPGQGVATCAGVCSADAGGNSDRGDDAVEAGN